jgi:sugar phosphate isomerase/epimerase
MAAARQEQSMVMDVHVRDYDGQPFTAEGRRRYLDPGEGQLDFPAIFGALVADGFRGPFMYEGSHTPVSGAGDVSAINAVLANMRRWLADADRDAAPVAPGAIPPTVTV